MIAQGCVRNQREYKNNEKKRYFRSLDLYWTLGTFKKKCLWGTVWNNLQKSFQNVCEVKEMRQECLFY